METETLGRVTTEAKIENVQDLWDAERGRITPEAVRSVHLTDALVDTGATRLSLPTSLIRTLGLMAIGTQMVRTSVGPRVANVFGGVRLSIQGRECLLDVLEVPDGTPVLVGQVPLELLDFVVDMKAHRLVGDPSHGGEFIHDMF